MGSAVQRTGGWSGVTLFPPRLVFFGIFCGGLKVGDRGKRNPGWNLSDECRRNLCRAKQGRHDQ